MLDILGIAIALLGVIGLACVFYCLVKVSPEESFASSVMSILLVIYIAGLCKHTAIGLYCLYVAAIVGIVLLIIYSVKQKNNLLKRFFTPGIVMIIGITGVGVIAFHGMQICNWDELYQWGKAANYMVIYDQLPSGANFSGESLLLSSTTFFHYFIEKIGFWFTGDITESSYYVSNLLLWFSALLLPISGTTWKEWKRIGAYGVFHFLLTAMIFVQPYYNIYTDQATAYWAGCVIAWLLLEKWNLRNVYLIPLVLVNVGLMKSMVGPLFAVIVIIALIVVHCATKRFEGEKILSSGWKRNIFSKKGIAVIAVIVSPFLLMGIWSVKTGQNGIMRFQSLFVVEGQEDRFIKTLKSMIGWIFQSVTLKDDKLYLSYGIFFVLTVAMVSVIAPLLLGRKQMTKYKSLMVFYLLGFAAYFLIMLIAYITVFGYEDSVRAQSLNRYYSDYMMLGIVPLTMPLFERSFVNRAASYLQKGILLICVIAMLYGSSDYLLPNLCHMYAVDTQQYEKRENLTLYAGKVKKLTGEEGKIYFINQKQSGLYTLVADYEMGDQVSRNGMCFKFRKNKKEAILGLMEYPISTLPNVLEEQQYSYLWVYSVDNYFKKNVKKLFGIEKVKNGDFYKVLNTEHGIVLEYIGNVQ